MAAMSDHPMHPTHMRAVALECAVKYVGSSSQVERLVNQHLEPHKVKTSTILELAIIFELYIEEGPTAVLRETTGSE